jgi:hypothetical protein
VFITFNSLHSKMRPDAVSLFGAGQGLTFTLFNKCKKIDFYSIHNYFFEPYKKPSHHKIFLDS